MLTSNPRSCIQRFLVLVENDDCSFDEREIKLSLLLDELAIEVAQLPADLKFVDFSNPPEMAFNALYSIVGPRFPNLGYYNTVARTTQNICTSDIAVVDANRENIKTRIFGCSQKKSMLI